MFPAGSSIDPEMCIRDRYGMTNLLEGDFFAWYCSAEQWNEELAKVIKEVSEVLCRYSGKAVLNNSQKSKDFFKKLYEAMVPAAVLSLIHI